MCLLHRGGHLSVVCTCVASCSIRVDLLGGGLGLSEWSACRGDILKKGMERGVLGLKDGGKGWGWVCVWGGGG